MLIQKATLVVICLVVGACSADNQTSSSISGGNRGSIDADEVQRALIACYEDYGIDARPLEGGAVHFDRNGTLTREESFELANTCEQEVQALGLLPKPDTSEAFLGSRYAELLELQTCLRDLGYDIPTLVSRELFVEDPSLQPHPYDHLVVLGNSHIERGYTECPDPGGIAITRLNP